jgi:hypothetical protein
MIDKNTSWSFSSYSTALSCLQKYKYVYVDKLQQEQEIGDLAFGKAVHSAINGSLEGEDGEMLFDLYWGTYKTLPVEYGRYKWDYLQNAGSELMRKFVKFYKPRLEPIIMEKRAYSEYKGMKVEGTLDFYGKLDGVESLIDWKTTGYPYDKDKALIALQLHLYAYLCINEFKVVPKQVVYFPFVKSKGSIQEPIIIPLDESKMHAMLDTMKAYVDKLGSSSDAPKNYNSCIMGTMKCQFFNKCHKGE